MGQPKVRFYFNVANRERALCQLAGKAYKQRLSVSIATASEAESHALDRLLWQVPSIGFLPHCFAQDPLAGETPVWLGPDLASLLPRDVVFNLIDHAWQEDELTQLQQAGMVIEIVARDDEPGRLAARQQVALYKRAGFEVEFTDMATLEQAPHHG